MQIYRVNHRKGKKTFLRGLFGRPRSRKFMTSLSPVFVVRAFFLFGKLLNRRDIFASMLKWPATACNILVAVSLQLRKLKPWYMDQLVRQPSIIFPVCLVNCYLCLMRFKKLSKQNENRKL